MSFCFCILFSTGTLALAVSPRLTDLPVYKPQAAPRFPATTLPRITWIRSSSHESFLRPSLQFPVDESTVFDLPVMINDTRP
ncbi:hypothetical protein LX36DRAFT_649415 [Colletotrichum falcatum]|nr:hypothetical protein LX36DRAFT_649415 [Colletotrichum falcatum]